MPVVPTQTHRSVPVLAGHKVSLCCSLYLQAIPPTGTATTPCYALLPESCLHAYMHLYHALVASLLCTISLLEPSVLSRLSGTTKKTKGRGSFKAKDGANNNTTRQVTKRNIQSRLSKS
eukprot:TRINITY_DN7504_c0_g1_i3.p1 TRINITY_DN7504_c0_g1~~TRINITY_DN7504_c0_g1_i3.p1  ORF type:complete len:119 (+),score=7.35 TRINITY_DN7504_c0_g1_i3:84-440(+)